LHVDPDRARVFALQTLDEYGRTSTLDRANVDVAGDEVTVTLHDHVDFSLLGIFMGGDHFEVEVHATAEPEERP
jgi:hypothetical protein